MSESIEHRKIKEVLSVKLKEWLGASIKEYPSSGHRLDIYAITSDRISIYVEIIWSSSPQNFFRDLNLIQQSDADVKLVIASPEVLKNAYFCREFSKVAVAQRRLGVMIHGELLDGQKILESSEYLEKNVKKIVLDLIRIVRYGSLVIPKIGFKPPEIPKADKVQEKLVSNLFPVKEYPSLIYSCPTSFRRESEVLDILGRKVANYPFILKRKRLYTFANLKNSENPFLSIIQGEVEEESILEWVQSKEKRYEVIRLLNLALRIYCLSRLNLNYDKKHRRFFCPLKDGKDNVFRWRAEEKFVDRTVAKIFYSEKGKPLLCRHYSAELRFMFINDELFLKIEPTIVFTRDGYRPFHSEKMAYFMSRWLSRQYNDQYLKLVRFWAKYLSKLDVVITIPVGEQKIIIDTIPAMTRINVGILREEPFRYAGGGK